MGKNFNSCWRAWNYFSKINTILSFVFELKLKYRYGPFGVLGAVGFAFASSYAWYKTAKFTLKKLYHHGLL